MKIIDIKSVIFPEIKVIRFNRLQDSRGYFSELYKKSDFQKIDFLKNVSFLQINGSFSKTNVIRGLHSQWNPYMNKLVRTINGHMIDLFLDIRIGSPTFGKIGAYDMKIKSNNDFGEWIWIPVGFAHGSVFIENTIIEYYCTAEYSPSSEVSISPLASDINWSLTDKNSKNIIDQVFLKPNVSEKDKGGFTLTQWLEDERSKNFIYGQKY
ncbi:dTDP-4-dehydrorhamnose 3,5-epimerase family protein [Candidatus Roizmanbacteria bacterium]|nr:dTDP-4-dehydrorhamnose 3,5-epimerase family protein [Candidatus Roizmanbacteria bacterium]